MAFGQGAGTMLATSAALLTAYTAYRPSFEERASANNWAEVELRSVEYARALGQVSAFAAARNGRCVIDSADVRAALRIVQRNQARPLSLCDLTPGIRRYPKESQR
jgi:hypothetical protein